MRNMHVPSFVLGTLLLTVFTPQNDLVKFINSPLPIVQSRAVQEGKLYFVHFTANWCLPCQWMDEHTYQDVSLADYIHRYYLPVRLNIDHPEGSAYHQQYEINSLPTILIFNARGELLDRYEESLDAGRMLQILQTHNQPVNRRGAPGLRPSPPKPRVNPELAAAQPPVKIGATSTSIHPSYITHPPDYQTLPTTAEQTTTTQSETPYTIQVGAYGDHGNALARARQVERQIRESVSIHQKHQNQRSIYRVLVGQFTSESTAATYLLKLRRHQVEGFVKDSRTW